MSSVGRWTYTNTATVRPRATQTGDGWSHGKEYGDEYTIDCTWNAISETASDDDGNEFVAKYEIFTEDSRPGYLDQIKINSTNARWATIRSVTEWDMSPFGEADSPDFKLVI